MLSVTHCTDAQVSTFTEAERIHIPLISRLCVTPKLSINVVAKYLGSTHESFMLPVRESGVHCGLYKVGLHRLTKL